MSFSIPKFIRSGGYWLLDAILVALVGSYASDSWNSVVKPALAIDWIRAVLIIVSSIALAIFTFYLILKKAKVLKGHEKEGTVEYFSYDDMPSSTEELFTKAKNEIYLLGITLQSLDHKDRSIKDSLKKINVNILICHEDTKYMDEIEQLVVSSKTRDRIVGTLGMLQLINDNISRDEQKRLTIKKFHFFPNQTIIAIDPLNDNGFIQFEPYLYKTSQQNRRIFKIEKRANPKLFDMVWNAYNAMWIDGKEI